MQTIAKTFGVPLKEMIEIGMTEVTTIKENPLFSSTFKAYSLHSLYVPPSDGFEVIAKSAFCPQVIKHKRKLIYGVLFHPEVRNEEILKRFMQLKKQE
jgi:GMP synthase (glutamine-hydrolysing)